MNKVILMGRLTRDPELRYSQNDNGKVTARYSLAVDRRFKREGEQAADFIGCVAFGKAAEFAEKWFHKGIKVLVTGRIQTGSYTNKDGQKIYTTDIIIEEQEFAESRAAGEGNGGGYSEGGSNNSSSGEGFMNVPEGIDEGLPFD